MATSDVAALYSGNIQKHFGYEVKDYPKIYPKFFHMGNMKGGYLDMQGWIPYGLPVERLPGEDVSIDQIRMDFNKRFTAYIYSLGDVIPTQFFSYDLYGLLVRWASARGGALARSYVTLEEKVAANYFINGFATVTGADGVALFSASHPVSAYDTTTYYQSRFSADVDLSMAALNATRAIMEQQLSSNSNTLIMNNLARIMVNPNLREIAMQLQKADHTPGSADLGNINTLQGEFEVVVNPYLRITGSTGGTVVTNGAGQYNGWVAQADEHDLYWWDAEDVRFDNDKDIQTDSVAFTSHRSFTLGEASARGMLGSKGS